MTKAFGGGSVEAKIVGEGWGTSSDEFASKKAELTAAFNGGLFNVSASVEGGTSSSFQSKAHSMLSQGCVRWSSLI